MSEVRQLIQIVPYRPAVAEGVGDYARLIAERMLAAHGIETRFISATKLPPAERCHDRWQTVELDRRAAPDLLAALADLEAAGPDTPVLLHMSGYGYHRKGVPLWVAAALARWRRANPRARLMTVFHELYAKGPIWGSAFWLGWAQIRGVRLLYRLSDAALVTTAQNERLVRRWEPNGPPLLYSPCFATVGEPAGPTPLASARPARLAVFGRGIHKIIYADNLEPLARLVAALGIEEIVDIGFRGVAPPASVAGVPVRAFGALPADALIAELSAARFGVLAYEADRLAKSSVFAALCACGTIPICISGEEGRNDGLAPGTHYLRFDPAGAPLAAPERDMLDRLQAGARSWYEPHSIAAAVDLIRDRLFAGPSSAKA